FAGGADDGSGTHNFFALDRQSRRIDLWRPLPSDVARREQRRFHLPASPVVPMTAAAPQFPDSLYNPRAMAQPEPNKVIHSMIGVSKFHAKKQVLKDIYLSYFYGAKIGVIGLNGSGKSSLLRVLAGTDRDFLGETVLSPGYTIGFLEQELQLDTTKTVRA